MSADIPLSVVARYRLYDQGIGVQFSAGARDFSLIYSVSIRSGVQSASYPGASKGAVFRQESSMMSRVV
jgi:hypothetical protein